MMSLHPQETIHSPFASLLIGMARLMDFPKVLTGLLRVGDACFRLAVSKARLS